ncbi:MAG: NUDIX hydrolase [Nesterenkonia sp.]
MSSKTIHVAAVVIMDPAQRVLTVRKRGTSRFMQPGGKPEPGESGLQTAVREVAEEIGLHLRAEQLTAMGTFSAAAANEADSHVVCENFMVTLDDDAEEVLSRIRPAAEIAQLRWVPLQQLHPSDDFAPLLTDEIAPAVRRLINASA